MIIPQDTKESLSQLLAELKQVAKETNCSCDSVDVELYISRTKEGSAGLKAEIAPLSVGGRLGGSTKGEEYSRVTITFTPFIDRKDVSRHALRENLKRKGGRSNYED